MTTRVGDKPQKSETDILQEIRLALGKRDDVRVFRNNNGCLYDKAGRLVKFGLGPGTSDLIGFVNAPIGNRAIFLAIEVKKPSATTPEEHLKQQRRFIDLVNLMGGYSGFADSVEDALHIVDGGKGCDPH